VLSGLLIGRLVPEAGIPIDGWVKDALILLFIFPLLLYTYLPFFVLPSDRHIQVDEWVRANTDKSLRNGFIVAFWFLWLYSWSTFVDLAPLPLQFLGALIWIFILPFTAVVLLKKYWLRGDERMKTIINRIARNAFLVLWFGLYLYVYWFADKFTDFTGAPAPLELLIVVLVGLVFGVASTFFYRYRHG
jgi:hypothetical protein